MPCPIIDHPGGLWETIQKYGARATHEGAEKMFTTLAAEGITCLITVVVVRQIAVVFAQ